MRRAGAILEAIVFRQREANGSSSASRGSNVRVATFPSPRPVSHRPSRLFRSPRAGPATPRPACFRVHTDLEEISVPVQRPGGKSSSYGHGITVHADLSPAETDAPKPTFEEVLSSGRWAKLKITVTKMLRTPRKLIIEEMVRFQAEFSEGTPVEWSDEGRGG